MSWQVPIDDCFSVTIKPSTVCGPGFAEASNNEQFFACRLFPGKNSEGHGTTLCGSRINQTERDLLPIFIARQDRGPTMQGLCVVPLRALAELLIDILLTYFPCPVLSYTAALSWYDSMRAQFVLQTQTTAIIIDNRTGSDWCGDCNTLEVHVPVPALPHPSRGERDELPRLQCMHNVVSRQSQIPIYQGSNPIFVGD